MAPAEEIRELVDGIAAEHDNITLNCLVNELRQVLAEEMMEITARTAKTSFQASGVNYKCVGQSC